MTYFSSVSNYFIDRQQASCDYRSRIATTTPISISALPIIKKNRALYIEKQNSHSAYPYSFLTNQVKRKVRNIEVSEHFTLLEKCKTVTFDFLFGISDFLHNTIMTIYSIGISIIDSLSLVYEGLKYAKLSLTGKGRSDLYQKYTELKQDLQNCKIHFNEMIRNLFRAIPLGGFFLPFLYDMTEWMVCDLLTTITTKRR